LPRKSKHKKRSSQGQVALTKRLGQPGRKKFSRQELSEFKKLILKTKESILDEIRHISDDTLKKSQKDASGDISGYSYHMADVATDTYDREFSLGLASNDRDLLYELDDALKKVEEGSYGICETCKSLIAKNRLKAVPYARLCVKCQEKKEKK
jgi:RNA polymerase-binding protein DksA